MRHIPRTYLALAVLTASAVSCSKADAGGDTALYGDGNRIAFYIKAPGTRSIIGDTQTLLNLAPDITVTDLSGNNPVFKDTRISHTGNGVWRSEKPWEDGKQYVFYAYVQSPGNGAGSELSSSNLGRNVTISQPSDYEEDDNAYTDFLMSYRVAADGTEKGLVQLDLERITTGVELYMSKSPGMTKVTLNYARFENVVRSAVFSISTPAASTDEDLPNGMKNPWTISRRNATADYEYRPDGGLGLSTFNPGGGSFTYDREYMVMNFLTVQQPTSEELSSGTRRIRLVLNYTVTENGRDIEYNADFYLDRFRPDTWTRGHKIRYYITVDTSIGLTGTVVPWEDIDFIEGTLLPD